MRTTLGRLRSQQRREHGAKNCYGGVGSKLEADDVGDDFSEGRKHGTRSPAAGARTINPHPAVCEDRSTSTPQPGPKTASGSCRPDRRANGKGAGALIGRGLSRRGGGIPQMTAVKTPSSTPSAEPHPPPHRRPSCAGLHKPPGGHLARRASSLRGLGSTCTKIQPIDGLGVGCARVGKGA